MLEQLERIDINFHEDASSNVSGCSMFKLRNGIDYNLEIYFKSGKNYTYYNVPPLVLWQFITAPSLGKFVYKHLKGKYTYE